MTLAFDYTLFVQFAQLLIVLILLHFLVFKPFLRSLGKRQETIASLAKEARGSSEGVETLTKAYDERLKERKAPILADREHALRDTHKSSMDLVEKARADLADELAKVKGRVASEVADTTARLKAESDAFAGRIIEKIMKRGA